MMNDEFNSTTNFDRYRVATMKLGRLQNPLPPVLRINVTMKAVRNLIESFVSRAPRNVLIAGLIMFGFMTVSCSTKQKIKYHIVGRIDDDACLYVITPARISWEGYMPAWTWIDKPASEGMVAVKTLAPKETRIGYLSTNRIPVDSSCAGGRAELILLPLEAGREVLKQEVSLGLTNSPRMGLRLEQIDPKLTAFKFRLSPEQGITLFETDDVGGYWFYRRGKPIERIGHSGNYALLSSTNMFLLRITSRSSNSVDLQLFRQPSTEGKFLYLNYERYLDQIRTLSMLKPSK